MAIGKYARNVKQMKTIAIAGAAHGVGTTHLCFTIASFLRKNNFKVALYEKNKNLDFQEYCENRNLSMNSIGFDDNGLDFYLNSPNTDITSIKSEGYDYLVIDMGTFDTCEKSIFTMANYNIIVASARYWNFSTLIQNVCNENNPNYSDYIYVFPFAYSNKKIQKEILESLDDINIYFLPYNEDPFVDCNIPELGELLSVGITEKPAPKKSLFGKIKKDKNVEKNNIPVSSEPEIEDFAMPEDKISIDDLKEITDNMIKNQVCPDKLIDALATQEFEEASRMNAPQAPVPNVVFANHVDESEQFVAPVYEAKPEPVIETKSEPKPEPIVESYKEESIELLRMAKHINMATKFDTIKTHQNAELLISLINNQFDLCNQVKERNDK